ncbi:unnamed protein product [Oreochromis niloticus]|nr:unnamed protein product [Mustela putorius furo]
MAGVVETCTHVAALLFNVEATVLICGTRTFTDEPAYWVLPGNMTKIQPEVGHKIDFSSSAAQKKVLDQNINRPFVVTGKRSRPQKRKVHPATVEELDQLMGQYFSKHSSVLNNP